MERKLKIVYIIHGLGFGGTEAFLINIIKALNKDRYEISIILAIDQVSRQLREEEVREIGVRIYKTCDLNGLKKITHLKKLKIILKETGPYDIVHSNMDLFNGLNLFIANSIGINKRISHSHNACSQYELKTKRHIIVKLYRFLMKKMIWNNSNFRLGCSKLANDYLYGKKWKNDDHAMVIYNGIQLENFLNKRKDFFKNRIFILTVGRFNAQKNPFFIIKIIKELLNLRKDFTFIWIGEGELIEEVKKSAFEYRVNECIDFLGMSKEVDLIMKKCDLFLLPSFFEGLPFVLIEAQASGLDCFISDTITAEIDAGKCKKISIKKLPREWAIEIDEYIKQSKFGGRMKLDIEKIKQFDIQNTVNSLDEIYCCNIK